MADGLLGPVSYTHLDVYKRQEYDRKFRNFWGSTKAVRRISDTICIENGLSIVENPNPHGTVSYTHLADPAGILRHFYTADKSSCKQGGENTG